MLDYDAEVAHDDPTRGGDRAGSAAASAVKTLLPGDAERILDPGGGTGVVSRHLASPKRTVIIADASMGMPRMAANRLPGSLTRTNAAALPLRENSLDAVTCLWPHLLTPAVVAAVLGEVARVPRTDGRFITTVDKDAGHRDRPDAHSILKPLRQKASGAADDPDAAAAVTALATRHGLVPAGRTGFPGSEQGPVPRAAPHILDQWFPTSPADLLLRARERLRALPDQDTPPPIRGTGCRPSANRAEPGVDEPVRVEQTQLSGPR